MADMRHLASDGSVRWKERYKRFFSAVCAGEVGTGKFRWAEVSSGEFRSEKHQMHTPRSNPLDVPGRLG